MAFSNSLPVDKRKKRKEGDGERSVLSPFQMMGLWMALFIPTFQLLCSETVPLLRGGEAIMT